jgi:Pyruvate/2-oxoacid:ferredoxin oxidoreductase gamma subunit
MLGALSEATGLVKLDSLEEPIKSTFAGRMGERNIEAVKIGAKSVRWKDY